LPTRLACGYNPTGSGAFDDSIDFSVLMLLSLESYIVLEFGELFN
jgi:hypothetical protein